MKLSKIVVLLTGIVFGSTALAQEMPVKAKLAGHVILPVDTLIEPPRDIPPDLEVSGKFTTGHRVEQPGEVLGKSDDGSRTTGRAVPVKGQPQQGHSGIKHMRDGSYWVISDNGYGSKANSPDAMLYLTHYAMDFDSSKIRVLGHVFLRDPDKRVPFRIVNEGTQERYLTGSDFDLESVQFTRDAIWIGDEFGPYLIKASREGRVLKVFDTTVDGKVIQSPDNPSFSSAGFPDKPVEFQVKRSKGFEGMAMSPDGTKLYPLLEGPLWDGSQYENVDGKTYLRILEFDLNNEEWTGRSWKFVLEGNDHAIGDFNMIDKENGLVIERDNGEGTADLACDNGGAPGKCFTNIAKFKRIYKINFSDKNEGQPVQKVSYIDLMNIADRNKVARKPLNNGVLTFPFFYN